MDVFGRTVASTIILCQGGRDFKQTISGRKSCPPLPSGTVSVGASINDPASHQCRRGREGLNFYFYQSPRSSTLHARGVTYLAREKRLAYAMNENSITFPDCASARKWERPGVIEKTLEPNKAEFRALSPVSQWGARTRPSVEDLRKWPLEKFQVEFVNVTPGCARALLDFAYLPEIRRPKMVVLLRAALSRRF